jgi:hypothetical protein
MATPGSPESMRATEIRLPCAMGRIVAATNSSRFGTRML